METCIWSILRRESERSDRQHVKPQPAPPTSISSIFSLSSLFRTWSDLFEDGYRFLKYLSPFPKIREAFKGKQTVSSVSRSEARSAKGEAFLFSLFNFYQLEEDQPSTFNEARLVFPTDPSQFLNPVFGTQRIGTLPHRDSFYDLCNFDFEHIKASTPSSSFYFPSPTILKRRKSKTLKR